MATSPLSGILMFSENLLAEAIVGDSRRDDLEDNAATAAIDPLARVFPADADATAFYDGS